VRQLEQVVRRTIIDSGGLVDIDLSGAAGFSPPEDDDGGLKPAAPLVSLDEAEKRHIAAVLKATGGNQTQAAFILGIERKTLARKIKRLGIEK